MGSNDHETGLTVGDPLAAEARREVRAKERARRDAGLWPLAQQMARAAAAMACKDDTGVMGGVI